MNVVSVLKKIGQIGIAVAPAVVDATPAGSALRLIPHLIASISGLAVTSATSVEAIHGAGSGPQKLATAAALMQALIPTIIAPIEQAIGRDYIDEALLARAVSKYLDASVDLLNAIKVPAAEPPAA